jgi:cytochrome c oxidase subunit 4
MTEHVASDGEPITDHTHAGIGDPNLHHHSPEEIRHEMKVYMTVFFALGVLTVVTVAVRFVFHLSIQYTILVAMIIALIKGSLVAGFFMHLISEKKLIYSILVLTVLFFLVLMSVPVSHYIDKLHY